MATLRALTVRILFYATATRPLSLVAALPAFSQEVPLELAITRRVSDAELQWGPCPAFFPAGCVA
jgi:hypothetical protein